MDSKEEKKEEGERIFDPKERGRKRKAHFVLGLLSVSSIRLPYKDAPLDPSINTALIFNGKEGGKKEGCKEMFNFLSKRGRKKEEGFISFWAY